MKGPRTKRKLGNSTGSGPGIPASYSVTPFNKGYNHSYQFIRLSKKGPYNSIHGGEKKLPPSYPLFIFGPFIGEAPIIPFIAIGCSGPSWGSEEKILRFQGNQSRHL